MNSLLLKWYHKNKRQLPWRNTCDPYKIWLSEIILQQTRVKQGLKYYNNFIDTYPTVFDLAKSNSDEVFLLWQGLGYYSRARNLLETAKIIVNSFHGEFPTSFKELKKLKGIGDYTAAAIASFAFNEIVPVVDGNVYRVLSRFLLEETPIDTTKGKKLFFQLADELIDKNHPGDFNQALMELGALICTPKTPNCGDCPLNGSCLANLNNRMEELPVKSRRLKKRSRYFYFFIISYDAYIYIEKRQSKDIWMGLYQFPLMELDIELKKIDDILEKASSVFDIKNKAKLIYVSDSIKHILSHQNLNVRFFYFTICDEMNMERYIRISKEKLCDFAMPRLITKYLESENFL